MQHLWVHARRKLCEIQESHRSAIAAEGLRRIAEMYAIEKEIRGEPPEVRLAGRQARTVPLVEDFGVWLRQQRARVSPKSRLGEKLAYIGNHWDGLQVFLTDGRVEMDNNVVYADIGILSWKIPFGRWHRIAGMCCLPATTRAPQPGSASHHWWKRRK